MEAKLEVLARRRQNRKMRTQKRRKESLMMAYIQIKHAIVYKEAERYYTKMNKIYPNKPNLLKTPRFHELKQTEIQDSMQLNIPLVSMPVSHQNIPSANPEPSLPTENELSTVQNSQPTVPTTSEPSTHQIPEFENPQVGIPAISQMTPVEIPEAQNIDVLTLTIDEIPGDMIESITTSLRRDPDLNRLMNEVESEITYQDEDIDIGIDVEIGSDLLEKELAFSQLY